jgi:hypothetical protein
VQAFVTKLVQNKTAASTPSKTTSATAKKTTSASPALDQKCIN